MAEAKSVDKRSEVTIPLEFPVVVDGERYESMTMRRPRVKDTLAAAKFRGNDAEKAIQLFARLCNVAPEVLEELDELDSSAISDQYAAFTGRQSD